MLRLALAFCRARPLQRSTTAPPHHCTESVPAFARLLASSQ